MTLHHDTFADNTEELLDTFERTWPPVSDRESIENLAALAKLFRQLGRPAVASRFIHEWVEQRKGDRVDELDSRKIYFFEPINDEEILDALSAVQAAESNPLELKDAIHAMGEHHGMNQAAIEIIAAATVHEILDTLTASPGRHLSYAIKQTLDLDDNPQRPTSKQARENMVAALTELSTRSPLLADRVRNKFGIRPASADP